MSVGRIPVLKGGKLVGFFDESAAVCLGTVGSPKWLIHEDGFVEHTSLLRLPNNHFVLCKSSWCEVAGHQEAPAELLTRDEAMMWLLENHIRPPEEMFQALGLTDFSAGAAVKPDHIVEHEPKVGGSAQESKVAKAMVCLYQHPDWTNGKIATEVGCHPVTLSKSKQFRAAREASKRAGRDALPRGYREEDQLEAYED